MLGQYCSDCRWSITTFTFGENQNHTNYFCVNPKLGKNYISGKIIPISCSDCRTSGYCGLKPKWFEKKVVWYKKLFGMLRKNKNV